MTEINKRIKSLMVLHGIRQSQLADYLGIKQVSVSNKMTNKTEWRVLEIIMLARLLNTNLNYLLLGESDDEKN